MRKCVLAGVIVLGSLGSLARAGEPVRGWHQSYSTAQSEAREFHLPLVLHFHARWCGPCQQMEAGVLNTVDVLEGLGRKIVGAKIDVDRYPDLADRFGVETMPTDVYLSPDGKVLESAVGYSSRSSYVGRIQRVGGQFQSKVVIDHGRAPLDPNAPPGLRGFSPVSISGGHVWKKGRSDFAWEFRGIVYHLASAEELARFQADPERYAPKLLGCDPLLLATEKKARTGDVRYGAFFRNRLYLLASAENRRRFLADPAPYADKAKRPALSEVQAQVGTLSAMQ